MTHFRRVGIRNHALIARAELPAFAMSILGFHRDASENTFFLINSVDIWLKLLKSGCNRSYPYFANDHYDNGFTPFSVDGSMRTRDMRRPSCCIRSADPRRRIWNEFNGSSEGTCR